MSSYTETETIKAAKKSHRCSWCYERIEVGSEYRRYRHFDQGDAGTVKMHPECYEAMHEAARHEGSNFEFYPGDNPRGCTCGFEKGCKTCEAREAAKGKP